MENYKEGETIFSIRKDGQTAYITFESGQLVTEGFIGENKYDNFVELIKGLYGFGISIDNFYT